MRTNGKQEQMLRLWIAEERERLLTRIYGRLEGFYAAFYAQCVESTAADALESFLEAEGGNYFRENRKKLNREAIRRFYQLAAIHHTIRTIQKRQKELDWEKMRPALMQAYALDAKETRMAGLFYECAQCYPSGFLLLFYQATARYVFGMRELDGFSFAFIGNFWYNSYNSFMGSFTGYVPFHIRLRDAL